MGSAGVGSGGDSGTDRCYRRAGAAGVDWVRRDRRGRRGRLVLPGPRVQRDCRGLVYQGTYSSATNYALGDVVLFQGASYASLLNGNHGNTPSLSPGQWGCADGAGTGGCDGCAGTSRCGRAAGLPGSVGPNGPQGRREPQGIPGQAGAQGLTGATGPQGLQGPMGPQGVAGPVGMTFRGAYSSAVNYALADGVVFNGSGYVSLVAGNHGNTPSSSPAQWLVFATGVAGPQGVAGPAGSAGGDWSDGAAGCSWGAGSYRSYRPAGARGGELHGELFFDDELWAA